MSYVYTLSHHDLPFKASFDISHIQKFLACISSVCYKLLEVHSSLQAQVKAP